MPMGLPTERDTPCILMVHNSSNAINACLMSGQHLDIQYVTYMYIQ